MIGGIGLLAAWAELRAAESGAQPVDQAAVAADAGRSPRQTSSGAAQPPAASAANPRSGDVPTDLNQIADPAASATEPTQIEEVVVTADAAGGNAFAPQAVLLGVFGERPIIDIPFSVQRFDWEFVEKVNARELSQIIRYDASVKIETTAGSYASTAVIRGFETTNYYYDTLTGPISTQPNFPVELIESVDVFKGPSSVIFGGGAAFGGVGGAINITPKRAPREGRIGELQLGYQTRNAYHGSLDVGGRFGKDGQFGYRTIIGGEYGELAARNNDVKDYFLYTSLEWRAASWLTVTAEGGHIRQRNYGYQDVLSNPTTFDLPDAPNAANNIAQPWTLYRVETDWGLLKTDLVFNENWSLELAGIYTRNEQPYSGGALIDIQNERGDFLITPRWADATEGDKWSFKATLEGKFETWVLKHDLQLNARYDYDKSGGVSGGFEGGPFTSNLYDPVYYSEPDRLPASGGYVSDFRTTTIQLVDFIELHPKFTVIAGLGYVNIEEAAEGYSEGAFTPLGALVFKPWETTSIYASYAEGLEEGGTAPMTAANAFEQLSPRTAWQAEAGVKHTWNRMNFSLAFFQIQRELEFINEDNRFVQDGTQIHRGIELNIGGDVTRDWSVFASGTFLDAEVDNGDPETNGNEPPGVPRWSARLFTEYRNLVFPGFAVNGALNYSDAQQRFLSNTATIEPFVTFDLGVSYDFRPRLNLPAMLRVTLENVADTQYYSSVSFGGDGLALGEPRTLKVSLFINF